MVHVTPHILRGVQTVEVFSHGRNFKGRKKVNFLSVGTSYSIMTQNQTFLYLCLISVAHSSGNQTVADLAQLRTSQV